MNVEYGTSSLSANSPLSLSFRARRLRFAVQESVRIESPPSDFLDPDMTSQETADAWIVIPVDIETPIYCSLDDSRVFSSVGMTFMVKQGLAIELVFVTVDRSEGFSIGCERKGTSFEESHRSKHRSSWEPWRQIPGTATTFQSRNFGCRRSTRSHVFEPPFVS